MSCIHRWCIVIDCLRTRILTILSGNRDNVGEMIKGRGDITHEILFLQTTAQKAIARIP